MTHRTPYPLNKGERIRAFHWIRHLALNHRVSLAAFASEPEAETSIQELHKYCSQVEIVPMRMWQTKLLALPFLLSDAPLTLRCFHSREMYRISARMAQDADIVIGSCSSMAPYALGAGKRPVIVDLIDVDSAKWARYGRRRMLPLSWLYKREAATLREYEGYIARESDACVVSTQAEASLYRSSHGVAPVVIPNGVDTDYFKPEDGGLRPASQIVFAGSMDYPPNVDAVVYFTRRILPIVQSHVPSARFVIVGRRPVPQVRRLGRNPHVLVTGEVPDVRPYLRASALSVAPFRMAFGMQNKVLEAMAMGLPVVCTPEAATGLDVAPGKDILVERTPAAFADAIVCLLLNSDARHKYGRAARLAVLQRYDWSVVLRRLDELLLRVTGATGTKGTVSVDEGIHAEV